MSEHYFTAEPASAGALRPLTVRLAGRELQLTTTGGVFSPDRVDTGTQVLLREVPDPPASGTLLDVGCGWGPLALTMALLSPAASVWAVDVNERALDLLRHNATSAGLTNVSAATPDQVADDVRFDVIWSNPPIRIGKQALHALLLHWLPRLAPGGVAYLVVQRHLGSDSLQRWLDDQLGADGYVVSRHASAKGYRVLQVTAPA
ncbi:MAG TPA: methyltransferase [Actinomycetales bacterium]|nr:methyltransferase [Actinomycetales bacterium]